MKIWCLFSIDNEYYQPENNLECWFSKKPSIENIMFIFDIKMSDNSESIISAVNLYKGEEVRINDIRYRLQEVEETVFNEKPISRLDKWERINNNEKEQND